jgi:hypothetical protein
MNSTRHFENENLKDRNIYLFRLLIAVAGLIGFQFLYPILKPSSYSGSIVEWTFTFSIILLLTVYFLSHKRFVSITFDTVNKKIMLTITTLISGTKVIAYNYAEISFKGRKNHWEFQKESNTVPRNL